ncbi:MAG TPA: MFS transporter, partial [Acetobacteraceae bacterium]
MSDTRDAVAPPRTRMTLAASCLGMAALGMNGTAIMAALPTMRRDLGLNPAQLEWAINAYLVVSAACIIPGGKACDHFGARRISTAGLALFALASAAVATAPIPAALLAGRALQGLAAALAVPGTLATVSDAALPERRASAIGAWAGFLMLGFSLGPLIGGVLTHYLDWRVVFWASAASMLVATAGFAGVGAPTARAARGVGHFDLLGFVLLSIAMTTVVSALHALPTLTSAPVGFLG